jgi:thiamine kinase-like enzyme
MRKGQEKISNLLPKISETLPTEALGNAQVEWTIQRVANNDTNTTVAFVNTLDGSAPMVIKLPANQKEIDSLARQSENLKSLSEDERLGDWRNLLPITLFQGNVDGQVYFVEGVLTGETIYNKLECAESKLNILKLAAAEIGNLHRMTSYDRVVDMSLLESWIREPVDNLRSLSTKSSMFKIDQRSIDHLETEMHSELIGQRVQVSWIHGDYSPKNILINAEGNQVTGIVDWDLAKPDRLPGLDVMHLLVSMRMKDHKSEMGQVVRELLLNEDWTSEELQVFQAAGNGLPESPLSLRVMLLLCWSQHINANLSKTARFDQHSVWISENILAVLNAL